MPNRLFYLHSSDPSISNIRGVWLVFIITIFYKNSVLNANSVDPGQTPRSAASDLGLHCLQMSLLLDARHKWVRKRTGLDVSATSNLNGCSNEI